MTGVGRLLIVTGFLLGALAAVRAAPEEGERQVIWPHFLPALGLGVIGVGLVRAGRRGEHRDEERVAARLEAAEESLDRIVDRLAELDRRRDEIDVYDLRGEIDRTFPRLIDAFVDSRESIAHRYGLRTYTDGMSHFAAGERYLNRAWCSSADGYVEEARRSLERSAEEFATARRILGEARARTVPGEA